MHSYSFSFVTFACVEVAASTNPLPADIGGEWLRCEGRETMDTTFSVPDKRNGVPSASKTTLGAIFLSSILHVSPLWERSERRVSHCTILVAAVGSRMRRATIHEDCDWTGEQRAAENELASLRLGINRILVARWLT